MEWIDKALQDIKKCKSAEALEALRISIFGKKGALSEGFAALKNLEGEAKKEGAKVLNEGKAKLENALNAAKEKLENEALKREVESQKIDVSLFSPHSHHSYGHPINTTFDKIVDYFVGANFTIRYGPLVEDDFHNFEALNLPKSHPARDMQDTFYFKDSMLLRTHTSPIEIRVMEEAKQRAGSVESALPIRIIAPGAVFRRDYDLTHSPMFHQVEGLVVDKGDRINFANLKQILEDFLRFMFGDVRVRFRASFFPFTEPSAEVDISCVFCGGSGCRVCSQTGWLEVLGCGVSNQKVFEAVGYENVSGYAFGLGVERFAMLLHKVGDLRSFFETDLRMLEQF